jgi:hypothetical protein
VSAHNVRIVRLFGCTVTLSGKRIGLVRTVVGANFVVSLHIPYHVANGDLEAKAELLAIVCQDRTLQSTGQLSLNQTRQHDIKGTVESVDVMVNILGRWPLGKVSKGSPSKRLIPKPTGDDG